MDEAFIKIEKESAKKLRASRWWQNKIAHDPCYYCGKTLLARETTMDHVLPLSRGGRSTKGNVVVACKDCNSKKRDDSIFSWNRFD